VLSCGCGLAPFFFVFEGFGGGLLAVSSVSSAATAAAATAAATAGTVAGFWGSLGGAGRCARAWLYFMVVSSGFGGSWWPDTEGKSVGCSVYAAPSLCGFLLFFFFFFTGAAGGLGAVGAAVLCHRGTNTAALADKIDIESVTIE
jgi:hypothetical protein